MTKLCDRFSLTRSGLEGREKLLAFATALSESLASWLIGLGGVIGGLGGVIGGLEGTECGLEGEVIAFVGVVLVVIL